MLEGDERGVWACLQGTPYPSRLGEPLSGVHGKEG